MQKAHRFCQYETRVHVYTCSFYTFVPAVHALHVNLLQCMYKPYYVVHVHNLSTRHITKKNPIMAITYHKPTTKSSPTDVPFPPSLPPTMGKIHMDQVRRRMFAAAEIPRLVLKSIVMSSRLPPSVRQAAQNRLAEMPFNTSPTRIRMRCVLTGRPRAVDSKTRLSRIKFRELASEGSLPGIWKAR